MKKRQAVRAVSFVLVFLVIFHLMSNVLIKSIVTGVEDNVSRIYAMYHSEKKNSWNGVIMGSSTIYCGWVAPVAWKEKGIAIYPVSYLSLSFHMYLNLIKEVEKTQDTDFFVVDLRGLRKLADDYTGRAARYVTDNMPMSVNRIDTVNRTLSVLSDINEGKGVQEDKLSYYIPFFKYHSRWSELEMGDYVKPESHYKGAVQTDKFAFTQKKLKKPKLTEECGELSDLQKKYLIELLEYGKEKNLQMLFISTPVAKFSDINEQKMYNEAFRIAESYGYKTINFNTEKMYQELDLDFKTDFRDGTHLNSIGGRKFTSYLADYVAETYDLEDLRGKEEYKDWDEAWEAYDKFYTEGWAKKELEEEENTE